MRSRSGPVSSMLYGGYPSTLPLAERSRSFSRCSKPRRNGLLNVPFPISKPSLSGFVGSAVATAGLYDCAAPKGAASGYNVGFLWVRSSRENNREHKPLNAQTLPPSYAVPEDVNPGRSEECGRSGDFRRDGAKRRERFRQNPAMYFVQTILAQIGRHRVGERTTPETRPQLPNGRSCVERFLLSEDGAAKPSGAFTVGQPGKQVVERRGRVMRTEERRRLQSKRRGNTKPHDGHAAAKKCPPGHGGLWSRPHLKNPFRRSASRRVNANMFNVGF